MRIAQEKVGAIDKQGAIALTLDFETPDNGARERLIDRLSFIHVITHCPIGKIVGDKQDFRATANEADDAG